MRSKLWLIICSILLTACSPSVTLYPTPIPTPTVLYISPIRTIAPTASIAPTRTNSLTGCANGNPNVRGGPGTQYESKGLLLSGTCGNITGRTIDAYWVYIQTTNLTGWVFDEYIRVAGDIDNATILENYGYIPPNDLTTTLLINPVKTAAPYVPPVVPTNPPSNENCDPSYPTVCIPPPPPDLDCGQINYRRFQVLPPDPHHFDGDHDGIGCET